ncbi:GNAT family N-acetyltransferase [soil metagenome]
MILAIENLTVRPYRSADVDSLSHHANEREIWLNLRDRFPFPYTKKDAREWVDLANRLKPVTNFAIEVDGQCVGGIGLAINQDVHRKSAELGYWLGKEYWGQGLMSKILAPMSDYYFANHDVVRIYAMVFDFNPASSKVLEKAGYELEGRLKKSAFKDGKFCDQLLYAKIR